MTGATTGVRPARGLDGPERQANDFVRFMRLVRPGPDFGDCWLWIGNRPDGRYGHFSVATRTVKAHRWIYEAVCGPIPDGLLLRHRCDNPACVNPNHLVPGTHADNQRDKYERCRAPSRKGERHPLARMTNASVRALRAGAQMGLTHAVLAARFSISRKQVSKIIRRENWGHVE